jgi:hypothetical protein
MSVCEKSARLMSSGLAMAFANAYENQSPKLRPAGACRLPYGFGLLLAPGRREATNSDQGRI